jgi:hypothetical protein
VRLGVHQLLGELKSAMIEHVNSAQSDECDALPESLALEMANRISRDSWHVVNSLRDFIHDGMELIQKTISSAGAANSLERSARSRMQSIIEPLLDELHTIFKSPEPEDSSPVAPSVDTRKTPRRPLEPASASEESASKRARPGEDDATPRDPTTPPRQSAKKPASQPHDSPKQSGESAASKPQEPTSGRDPAAPEAAASAPTTESHQTAGSNMQAPSYYQPQLLAAGAAGSAVHDYVGGEHQAAAAVQPLYYGSHAGVPPGMMMPLYMNSGGFYPYHYMAHQMMPAAQNYEVVHPNMRDAPVVVAEESPASTDTAVSAAVNQTASSQSPVNYATPDPVVAASDTVVSGGGAQAKQLVDRGLQRSKEGKRRETADAAPVVDGESPAASSAAADSPVGAGKSASGTQKVLWTEPVPADPRVLAMMNKADTVRMFPWRGVPSFSVLAIGLRLGSARIAGVLNPKHPEANRLKKCTGIFMGPKQCVECKSRVTVSWHCVVAKDPSRLRCHNCHQVRVSRLHLEKFARVEPDSDLSENEESSPGVVPAGPVSGSAAVSASASAGAASTSATAAGSSVERPELPMQADVTSAAPVRNRAGVSGERGKRSRNASHGSGGRASPAPTVEPATAVSGAAAKASSASATTAVSSASSPLTLAAPTSSTSEPSADAKAVEDEAPLQNAAVPTQQAPKSPAVSGAASTEKQGVASEAPGHSSSGSSGNDNNSSGNSNSANSNIGSSSSSSNNNNNSSSSSSNNNNNNNSNSGNSNSSVGVIPAAPVMSLPVERTYLPTSAHEARPSLYVPVGHAGTSPYGALGPVPVPLGGMPLYSAIGPGGMPMMMPSGATAPAMSMPMLPGMMASYNPAVFVRATSAAAVGEGAVQDDVILISDSEDAGDQTGRTTRDRASPDDDMPDGPAALMADRRVAVAGTVASSPLSVRRRK